MIARCRYKVLANTITFVCLSITNMTPITQFRPNATVAIHPVEISVIGKKEAYEGSTMQTLHDCNCYVHSPRLQI